MDFDSLSISKNNNIQGGAYSAELTSSNKNSAVKASSESVKVNTPDLKVNSNSKSNHNKNGEIKDDTDGIYKGNYKEDVEKAVKIANEKLKNINRQFSYSIHEQTKRVMITIKDSDGNVIKEVPSQESLDFFAKLQELSGMLLDEKR